MPLPSDEKILALSNDLLQMFDGIFGVHPGFRPAHAKGAMFTGTFTPAPGATSPMFRHPSPRRSALRPRLILASRPSSSSMPRA